MNSTTKICITAVVLVTILTAGYLYANHQSKKVVYILNDRTFAEFAETKAVKKKLNEAEAGQKYILDSVYNQMQQYERSGSLNLAKQKKDIYDRLYEGFAENNQKLGKQYNESIWKHINQYLDEFGKENNYALIMGASGNGNLMYADTTLNVTKEALLFINMKYAGE